MRTPESSLVLPRLPFRCPEFLLLNRIEGVLDIGMPVAMADNLLVDQQVIALTKDVGQQPAVPIPASRNGLDFQPDSLGLIRGGKICPT